MLNKNVSSFFNILYQHISEYLHLTPRGDFFGGHSGLKKCLTSKNGHRIVIFYVLPFFLEYKIVI